jgi:short-subunit dehydrogenase
MTSSRTAVITGASRGLGLALARELAQRRWNLIIDARGAEALDAVRSELTQLTHVVALTGDIADRAHRRALVVAARAQGHDASINASVLAPVPNRAWRLSAR